MHLLIDLLIHLLIRLLNRVPIDLFSSLVFATIKQRAHVIVITNRSLFADIYRHGLSGQRQEGCNENRSQYHRCLCHHQPRQRRPYASRPYTHPPPSHHSRSSSGNCFCGNPFIPDTGFTFVRNRISNDDVVSAFLLSLNSFTHHCTNIPNQSLTQSWLIRGFAKVAGVVLTAVPRN